MVDCFRNYIYFSLLYVLYPPKKKLSSFMLGNFENNIRTQAHHKWAAFMPYNGLWGCEADWIRYYKNYNIFFQHSNVVEKAMEKDEKIVL